MQLSRWWYSQNLYMGFIIIICWIPTSVDFVVRCELRNSILNEWLIFYRLVYMAKPRNNIYEYIYLWKVLVIWRTVTVKWLFTINICVCLHHAHCAYFCSLLLDGIYPIMRFVKNMNNYYLRGSIKKIKLFEVCLKLTMLTQQ